MDHPLVEAVKNLPVLCDIRQEHRYDQHHAHLVQNKQEGIPERHACTGVYQRETDGDEQGADKVGEERIGRHLLEVAA